MDFHRLPGETNEQFFDRLLTYKSGMTWDEFAAIYSDITGETVHSDTCRKRFYQIRDAAYDPFRELQRQKQTFRDERNGWQKQNREIARTTENLDMLRDELKKTGSKLFEPIKPAKTKPKKKTMLILFTDWHIGAEYENQFGAFSYDIAKKRAKKLLKNIHELQKEQNCERAVVMCCGDMINGAIRRTVQIQNRQTVIEQIKSATELLANLCHMFCRDFPKVTLTGCAGNHSRLIENKESAVKDDRLDSIITWAASLMLSHIDNFNYIEAPDTTLASVDIYGHEILGVHGDYDGFSRSGTQNLISTLHRFPYAICYGHLHSPAFQEADGVLLIRGGSLCGTGDDYTIQKRLSGKPSQTIMIFTQSGLESIHPVFL